MARHKPWVPKSYISIAFFPPSPDLCIKYVCTQKTEVFQKLSALAPFPELGQGCLSANEAEAASQLLPPQSRASVACCCHLTFAGYSSAHSRSVFPILAVHLCGYERSHLIPWDQISTLVLRPGQGVARVYS